MCQRKALDPAIPWGAALAVPARLKRGPTPPRRMPTDHLRVPAPYNERAGGSADRTRIPRSRAPSNLSFGPKQTTAVAPRGARRMFESLLPTQNPGSETRAAAPIRPSTDFESAATPPRFRWPPPGVTAPRRADHPPGRGDGRILAHPLRGASHCLPQLAPSSGFQTPRGAPARARLLLRVWRCEWRYPFSASAATRTLWTTR